MGKGWERRRHNSFAQEQDTVRKGWFPHPGVRCRARIRELFHRGGTRPAGWGQGQRDTAVSPSSLSCPSPMLRSSGQGQRRPVKVLKHFPCLSFPSWKGTSSALGAPGLHPCLEPPSQWRRPRPSPASPTGEALGDPLLPEERPRSQTCLWPPKKLPCHGGKDPGLRIDVNKRERSLGRENPVGSAQPCLARESIKRWVRGGSGDFFFLNLSFLWDFWSSPGARRLLQLAAPRSSQPRPEPLIPHVSRSFPGQTQVWIPFQSPPVQPCLFPVD